MCTKIPQNAYNLWKMFLAEPIMYVADPKDLKFKTLDLLTVWKVSVFEVFLVHIFLHSDEYGEIFCISSYSVQMRENMDQKIPEYLHFLRSGLFTHCRFNYICLRIFSQQLSYVNNSV